MKIAGIDIPAKLEFGNKEHIDIRVKVEHRMEVLDVGFKCPYCKIKMGCAPNYETETISWVCLNCEEAFDTNLDGE